jgi:hypothetical protein
MHLAPLRELHQATDRYAIGDGLSQPLGLLLRRKLIARRKQFRQHNEIGIRLLQLGRDNVEIRGHFAKLGIELVKPNAHGTLRFI